MKPNVIYIGSENQLVDSLRSLHDCTVRVISRLEDILQEKDRFADREVLFLVEKSGNEQDHKLILDLGDLFPKGIVILVGEEVALTDRIDYLTWGYVDMISAHSDTERIRKIVAFYLNHQGRIKAIGLNNDLKLKFHLPFWKRLFDVVFSSIALVILLPILLIIVVAIRLESKGPVIYCSKRVGSNYEIFNFLKFRSMYVDADKRLKEFEKLNQYQKAKKDLSVTTVKHSEKLGYLDGMGTILVSDDRIYNEHDFMEVRRIKQDNAFLKFEKDPRVSRVGAFIRKYSLDELPQLINILIGDMSVVGNRPLPLYEAELLTKDAYIDRFLAPSGLTGLWQVEKRGDSGSMSAEERKQLDLKYAKKFTFWMDLGIILKTFKSFVQKEDV